jgi:hypothetical protein
MFATSTFGLAESRSSRTGSLVQLIGLSFRQHLHMKGKAHNEPSDATELNTVGEERACVPFILAPRPRISWTFFTIIRSISFKSVVILFKFRCDLVST